MSADDLLRAMKMVTTIGGLDHDVCARVMSGAPWSKSRVRFNRKSGRTYVSEADRVAEGQTAKLLGDMLKQPYTGNVAVACIFFRPNRQRIDVDNMLKHVCDAATGVIWADDSQCTALLGVAELDPAHPRTVVAIAAHVSTLTRGTDWTQTCQQCGESFALGSANAARKYCSPECASIARSGSWLQTPIACAQCGKEFRRITKTQKMCSPECRADSLRGRNRARSSPRSRCTSCGKQLDHHRGGRCRDCWRADTAGTAMPTQGVLL